MKTSLYWLGILAGWGLIIAILSFCAAGCSAPAPAHITLPTTAAIRAPLAAAKTHVDRSLAIGVQEQALATAAKTGGIVAGSFQANQLLADIAADNSEKAAVQTQLTAALYQAGELDRLQAEKQAQIDALEKHDAKETGLAKAEALTIKKVEHSRRLWFLLFLVSLVADYFFGSFIEVHLRGLVAFAWHFLALGYHAAAGVLKAIFPLYTFWLPA